MWKAKLPDSLPIGADGGWRELDTRLKGLSSYCPLIPDWPILVLAELVCSPAYCGFIVTEPPFLSWKKQPLPMALCVHFIS